MTDLDIIKECRQTGKTRTTTKNLLEKAYYEQMTNEIDISKVLIEGDTATIMGEKYKRIEEPKSPAEKAYYSVYGWYPPTTSSVSNYEDNRWRAFQNGYNASKVSETPQEPEEPETLLDVIRNLGYSVDMCYEIVDAVEEFEKSKEPEKWDVVRESKKWCEEHQNESVEDYLKPHTPEKTEKSLREAFVKAQQTEKWKETQRKIDSNYDDMVKNPPEFLKFELGKTLEQLIERWWCDVFVGPNEKWTMEECIADLCDRIHLWLPKEQSAAGSQSLGVEDMVEGFNDAIKKIKSKIHNKKDT